MRRGCILLVALLGSASGLVHAQEQRDAARALALIRRFRNLELEPIPRREEMIKILEELATIEHHHAELFLLRTAEDDKHLSLRGDLLVILSKIERDAVAPQIEGIMRRHMGLSDPFRPIARGYLVKRSVRTRNEEWLVALFAMGTTEDKFLALDALGKIGSPATLETARTLALDRSWEPQRDTPVHMGTIIASLRDVEGTAAARLLLLITKDERFTERDAAVLRDTTRLWRERDLRRYIEFTQLADRDPMTRMDAAAFLGLAGIEAARAPLTRVATRSDELPEVRAAAAEALGGLTIARGDLVRTLAGLADDENPIVRNGAILGLSRLGVRQAAEALVDRLDGPDAVHVRRALAAMTGLPAETDWKGWLVRDCALPAGT